MHRFVSPNRVLRDLRGKESKIMRVYYGWSVVLVSLLALSACEKDEQAAKEPAKVAEKAKAPVKEKAEPAKTPLETARQPGSL